MNTFVLSMALVPLTAVPLIAQTVDRSSGEVEVDTSSDDGNADRSSSDVPVDRSSNEIEVDTSTGEVGNSSAAPSVVPPQPVPVELMAQLVPAETDSKTKGGLRFSLVGDVMTAAGRIEGLKPAMRYQLAIPPATGDMAPAPAEGTTAVKTPQNDGIQRNDKDPATGAPAAGTPGAGTPQATPPAAGKPDAGKPDGSFRPGAPGAGEGSSVTGNVPSQGTRAPEEEKPASLPGAGKVSGMLGIVTADSAGTTDVSITVRSLALIAGRGGIQGRTVTLTAVPMEGETSPVLIASGVLEISGKPGE
ncbi:MAG: hypothetical protein EOP84_11720 [Verrucomicrobiaceae bacterium]|nr:MAG: hypothetical protein EOP84_11720 [Verrucomicrobiaceae bacterium]